MIIESSRKLMRKRNIRGRIRKKKKKKKEGKRRRRREEEEEEGEDKTKVLT